MLPLHMAQTDISSEVTLTCKTMLPHTIKQGKIWWWNHAPWSHSKWVPALSQIRSTKISSITSLRAIRNWTLTSTTSRKMSLNLTIHLPVTTLSKHCYMNMTIYYLLARTKVDPTVATQTQVTTVAPTVLSLTKL